MDLLATIQPACQVLPDWYGYAIEAGPSVVLVVYEHTGGVTAETINPAEAIGHLVCQYLKATGELL